MRLSSRLSDENQRHGEIEPFIYFDRYATTFDEYVGQTEDEHRETISSGDIIDIQIGKVILPFYSETCNDSISFISPKKLHCLVVSRKMISIDCQLTCTDFDTGNAKCQGCVHCIQAWFLVEVNDIFSDRPIVSVIRKSYELPKSIKLPIEKADKYSEWLAKAELAHGERLGAGAAIYLRAVFENLVYEIGKENGIEKTFINKWQKEQHKSFEQYLVSVDSVCKIIPEQYSQNGYDLFRRLSNIAHGNADEETALSEYEPLRKLVLGIINNVKKKREEIKNNYEIQKALQELGFSDI